MRIAYLTLEFIDHCMHFVKLCAYSKHEKLVNVKIYEFQLYKYSRNLSRQQLCTHLSFGFLQKNNFVGAKKSQEKT